MTPPDAAKLLELADDATPEAIEARFLDLRTKFEDKIAKAPTPGLKAKYRESLDQITTAFETLTLASDSSSLPVLKKESGVRRQETGGSASPRAGSPGGASLDDLRTSARPPAPAGKKKSSSKEFILVAVIAVAVLGAGGWWVVKSREEAAVAKAAKQAEAARVAQIQTELQTALAETAVLWEATTRAENDADRQLSSMQSELRSRRDATPALRAEMEADLLAFESYVKWLREMLGQHPYKLVRARMEALLKAGSIDEAARDLPALRSSLATLKSSLAANRDGRTSLTIVSPVPDASWELRDALGRVRRGTGSTTVAQLPFGAYQFRASRPPLTDYEMPLRLSPQSDERPDLTIVMPHGVVRVPNLPEGTKARLMGRSFSSSTPDTFVVPFGEHTVQLRHPDFLPRVDTVTVSPDKPEQVLSPAWISVKDPSALLREYIAQVGPMTGWQEHSDLNEGLDAAHRAGVPLGIITSAWSDALRLDGAEFRHPRDRLYAELRLAHSLRFLSPATARRAVEKVADVMLEISPGDRAAYLGIVAQLGWDAAPEAALRVIERYEDTALATQKPNEAANLYRAYLNLGEEARAEAWRDRCLAQPRVHVDLATQFGATRGYISPHAPLIERWEKARVTHAFGDLGSLKSATEAVEDDLGYALVSQIGRTYFTLGYDRTAAQWVRQTNSDFNSPIRTLIEIGRFDLAEELAENSRDASTVPEDLIAEVALAYAISGNAAKAKQLDEKISKTAFYSVMSKRALVNALLGNKSTANSVMDQIEKSTIALVPTNNWRFVYQRYMNAAALVLGDTERPARVDVAAGLEPGKLPADILVLIGRYDDANRMAAGTSSGFAGRRNLKALVAAALQRPDDALEHLDLHEPLAQQVLTLELLSRLGAKTPRSYQNLSAPTPAKVPAQSIIRKTVSFPDAVANRGVTKGEAKLRVLVRPDGSVAKTETLSTTEPEFATFFSSSVSGWTFAPTLIRGKAVEDWIELSHTFTK